MDIKKLFKKSFVYSVLKNDLKHKTLNHTYMLISPDTYLLEEYVRLFSQTIFCTGKDKPCFSCIECEKVKNSNKSDLLYFPKGKRLSVEESRKIAGECFVLPYEGDKKIFIINSFDSATVQSQNALLKTLEEPSKSSIFLLTAKNEHMVLNTIKSRAKKIVEPLLDKDSILAFLKKENTNYPTELLENIASNSGGNLTLAKNMLLNKNTKEILVLVKDIFKNLSNSSTVLENSSKVLKYKDSLLEIFDSMLIFVREMIVAKIDKSKLSSGWEEKEVVEIANNYYERELVQIAKKICLTIEKLNSNCNPIALVDGLLMDILEVKFLCRK